MSEWAMSEWAMSKWANSQPCVSSFAIVRQKASFTRNQQRTFFLCVCYFATHPHPLELSAAIFSRVYLPVQIDVFFKRSSVQWGRGLRTWMKLKIKSRGINNTAGEGEARGKANFTFHRRRTENHLFWTNSSQIDFTFHLDIRKKFKWDSFINLLLTCFFVYKYRKTLKYRTVC